MPFSRCLNVSRDGEKVGLISEDKYCYIYME